MLCGNRSCSCCGGKWVGFGIARGSNAEDEQEIMGQAMHAFYSSRAILLRSA